MERFLITGGSGFIGTNLIETLLKDKIYTEILNLDIQVPKKEEHKKIWKQVDIRESAILSKVISDFQPDYVVHLAARTDLNGKTLQDYETNMGGVSNLLDALDQIPNLKRVVFASSMYVCEPGYIPDGFEDYAPHTWYGVSKVETESRVKKHNPDYVWSLIRPTSIWGPWFEEPYNKFFHIVLNHMYFHMGRRACKKTYGYVDNAVYQILSILHADTIKVNKKVFYIGDYEPYDITEWANDIAREAGIWIPRVPFWCFVCAGWFGDMLKKIGISFPMTSFRLHNMTTDNVHNLDLIKEIAPYLPVSRIEGIRRTLDWISKAENKIH